MKGSRVLTAAGVATIAGCSLWLQCDQSTQPPDAAIDSGSEKDAIAASDGADAVSPCIHPSVVQKCNGGWCEIPAGCFTMGSPKTEYGRGPYTETQRSVFLTHAFVIMEREVTLAEWMALGFPSHQGWCVWSKDSDGGIIPLTDCTTGDCPAAGMVWVDALRFANALSSANGYPACYAISDCTGGYQDSDSGSCTAGPVCNTVTTPASPYDCTGFRLPTEAEWEYAARAGTTTAFYSGGIEPQGLETNCVSQPNLMPIGWYCYNSGFAPTTHVGKQKMPNAWGLYDMSGNASEFTSDVFHGDTLSDPQMDPWELSGSGVHIVRGGYVASPAPIARAAFRASAEANVRQPGSGFRLVRTIRPN